MKREFHVAVETNRDTGKIVAVYLRVRRGRVADTREHVPGALFADYNSRGELLGIEMLAPCKAAELRKVASDDPAVKEFFRLATPRAMVAA